MLVDVIMPQMGESVAEGTIVKWTKNIGDSVQQDETLLEISTDKVDSEIPAPADGVLAEIKVKEGETVEVGTVVAVIEIDSKIGAQPEPAKKDKAEAAPEETGQTVAAQAEPAAIQAKEVAEIQKQESRKITPLARSVAEKEDITGAELQVIPASGYGGRLVKDDILHYLAGKTEKTKPAEKAGAVGPVSRPAEQPKYQFAGNIERVPMTHMRKSIAEHMVASVRISPHVTSIHEIDVTKIMQYISEQQNEFRKKEGVKLTLTSFVAQAAVKALKEFPSVNASIDGDDIVYHKEINLGIAVALENGLIVPVIRRAGELNLVGLTKAIFDLATRARTKKLSPDEVQGGTFSITNFGVFDTLIGMPIINQPQVAILGTGAANQKPVIVDGMIAVRWIMYLSLTYDHRLLDGAVGGRFLQRMTEILEEFAL